MTRRVHRNPPLLTSRVSVGVAINAWPGLRAPFARAAAIEVLMMDSWLPGDPDAERATRAKTSAPIRRVLRLDGSPLAQLAAAAFGRDDAPMLALAPMALPRMQQAFFAAWDASGDARAMLDVLAHADRRVMAWAAAQVARVVLPYVPAREPRPLRAIEAAEAWARGSGTMSRMKTAQRAARDYAEEIPDEERGGLVGYAAFAAGCGGGRDAAEVAATAMMRAEETAWPSFEKQLAKLAQVVRDNVTCPELVL